MPGRGLDYTGPMRPARPARPLSFRRFGAVADPRWALIAALAVPLSGCSLAVMGGKMLFGDPTNPPVFTEATDIDLTDGEHSVLVLASSPESVKQRFPEVDQEVMRRVSRQLRTNDVEVVGGEKVLDWVEERGGIWDEALLGPIAGEFEVDYIVTVELTHFTWFENNSPDLLRGHAGGWIRAYKATGELGASHVLAGEFESLYPTHAPKSIGNISPKLFREKFLDRLCLQAAQRFVPHRPRDTIY